MTGISVIIQPNSLKCWHCMFLQTKDVLKNVCFSILKLDIILHFCFRLNVVTTLRFVSGSVQVQNHLIRVRKRSRVGLKYLVLTPQARLMNGLKNMVSSTQIRWKIYQCLPKISCFYCHKYGWKKISQYLFKNIHISHDKHTGKYSNSPLKIPSFVTLNPVWNGPNVFFKIHGLSPQA